MYNNFNMGEYICKVCCNCNCHIDIDNDDYEQCDICEKYICEECDYVLKNYDEYGQCCRLCDPYTEKTLEDYHTRDLLNFIIESNIISKEKLLTDYNKHIGFVPKTPACYKCDNDKCVDLLSNSIDNKLGYCCVCIMSCKYKYNFHDNTTRKHDFYCPECCKQLLNIIDKKLPDDIIINKLSKFLLKGPTKTNHQRRKIIDL